MINEDQQSHQIVLAQLEGIASLRTIGDVIQIMEKLDAVLPAKDGVKWFNLLYLLVTKAVYEQPRAHGWADERWLIGLDIAFAHLYFDALGHSYTNAAKVPRAWMALFESRYKPEIERVQFALAGVNAHINHDLPLAVVQTCNTLGVIPHRNTAQYRDYETVNSILQVVEPEALRLLATGLVGEVAQSLGTITHLLTLWSVKTARDTAWTNAEVLWALGDLPLARESFLLGLDRLTGFAGRGLLTVI